MSIIFTRNKPKSSPEVNTSSPYSRLFSLLKIILLIGAVCLAILYVMSAQSEEGLRRWFSIAPFILVLMYAILVVTCVLFGLWYLLKRGWKFLLTQFSPTTAQRIEVGGCMVYVIVWIIMLLALKNSTVIMLPLILCAMPVWIYIFLGLMGAFDLTPKPDASTPPLPSHTEGMFLTSQPKITILTPDGQIKQIGKKKLRRMRRDGKQVTVLNSESDES